MKHLVIVESPTKAKTISKFLGKDYRVESSFGHIRDLPKSEMGVDIEHDFAPHYVIPKANQKRATELKKLAKASDDVYFATDQDREGEAISWHLQEILKVPKDKIKRIAFHEITKTAVMDALEHAGQINLDLVDAQQARRVLDRLVGYELSPFLWRKVAKGLSAGRVQSVAVRLVVEREKEIEAFVPQEYWTIEIDVADKTTVSFHASLHAYDGKTLDKFEISNEKDAQDILKKLESADYTVKEVTMKDTSRKPPTPFTTSTLQQDANRRLRFSPKQTMMFAQQLYEGIEAGSEEDGGYITYMRTDSVNLSEKFLSEAQEVIKSEYGTQYAKGEKKYATKSKLAQEAHEAIRPTLVSRTPESVKAHLTDAQFKLYDLIWRRSVASQMPDALYEATTIDIDTLKSKKSTGYVFRATGQIEKFDGFTRVYQTDREEVLLPAVKKDDALDLLKFDPEQHFTKPPARYSEAGLVKVLEEHGVGRPSTYAPTISTIVERKYVIKEEGRLKPTEMATLVNDILMEHFPQIVDYEFTARMEDDLDEVANGKKDWVPVIREFYTPFKKLLGEKDKELSKKELTEEVSDEVCDKCGKPMVSKIGRFGRFFACTGYPECKNTKPIESKEEQEEDKKAIEEAEPCDKCGAPMVIKTGRFGKFLGCSKYPECKSIRSLSLKKLGIVCPDCGKGQVVEKKTKRGKMFYGCDKYPECTYASWEKPTGADGEPTPEKQEE
ncbi:MAG: type I DNA topoisomerase [bacterium]|nr:type I DNA topoisomerase [bacterium]